MQSPSQRRRVAPTPSLLGHLDLCLQCRNCETACPSGVPFGRLMEGTRVALSESAPVRRTRGPLRRGAEWFGYVVVLPRHGLLLGLTWFVAVAQKLRLVPRRLGLPRLSLRSVRAPLVPDGDPDVFLFTGCVMDAWQREVHRDALRECVGVWCATARGAHA